MQIGKVAVSPVFSCFALALCCFGLMAAENRSVWTAAGRDVAHTVGRKILERQQRLGERSNNAWAKFYFSPNKAARSSGPHK